MTYVNCHLSTHGDEVPDGLWKGRYGLEEDSEWGSVVRTLTVLFQWLEERVSVVLPGWTEGIRQEDGGSAGVEPFTGVQKIGLLLGDGETIWTVVCFYKIKTDIWWIFLSLHYTNCKNHFVTCKFSSNGKELMIEKVWILRSNNNKEVMKLDKSRCC